MNSHQTDIVRLAWVREFGLPDDASLDDAARLDVIDDDADHVRFVVIDGRAILVGPADIVDRAADLSHDVLATRDGLSSIVGDRRGRCGGPSVLAYLDEVRDDVPVEHPLVSHDRSDADTVLASVPPDDAAGLRRVEMSWFTVFDDAAGENDAIAVASCGYVEWQGFVAVTAALTVPSHRRRGFGLTAGRLATNDAMDAGLIPQLRVAPDNPSARLYARKLGFTELGVEIGMELRPPG